MDNFELLETISGKWVKVSRGFNSGAFLFEISENVLLSISLSNKNIHFAVKDKTGVYTYMGDVTFESIDDGLIARFFSNSINDIKTGNNLSILNSKTNISDVTISFIHDQKNKWLENRTKTD